MKSIDFGLYACDVENFRTACFTVREIVGRREFMLFQDGIYDSVEDLACRCMSRRVYLLFVRVVAL